MDCTRVETLIPDYSAAALSAREQRAVAVHLETCEACRAELRRLERVMALVERHGALEPPPGMWAAVAARLERETAPSPLRSAADWLFGARLRTAWAGAGVAVATAAVWLVASLAPGEPPAPPLVQSDPSIAALVQRHALSSSYGPLADRVAWEALVQRLDAPDESAEATGLAPAPVRDR